MSSVASTRVRLFHDGALQVVVDDDLLDLVEPWLPTPPLTGEPRSEPLARITVGRTTPNRPDALVGRTIVAGTTGVYLSCLFLWRGNLWVVILPHALFDLAGLLYVVYRPATQPRTEKGTAFAEAEVGSARPARPRAVLG